MTQKGFISLSQKGYDTDKRLNIMTWKGRRREPEGAKFNEILIPFL